jgi:hypothetical protein
LYKLRVYYGPDDVPGPSELYKGRVQQTGAAAMPRAAGPFAPTASPAQGSRSPSYPTTAPSSRGGNEGFSEPSPLEIVLDSAEHEISEHDLVTEPMGKKHDAEPLLPIVFDDSDEIIDLD